MNSAERRVVSIIEELVEHINELYVKLRFPYIGSDYEYQRSAQRWAAKEFYFEISDRAPKTPTDLYLIAECFVRKMNSLSSHDYMFSIAYDVAVELYDFIIGV